MSLEIRDWLPGHPITEPGVYTGVPMDVYHTQACCDGPSISSSGLRKILMKGPKAFYVTSEHCPDRDEEDGVSDNEGMLIGRAAHHLLLGEKEFTKQFTIRPETFADYKTNAAKAWRAGEEAKGKTCLIPKQIKQVAGMASALAEHPMVKGGLLKGYIECSIFWKDKTTGIWLKSRPDVIPTIVEGSSCDVADFKGTSQVDADTIDRSIFDYRYDMQGALIGMGLRETLNLHMATFTLVFAGFKQPHDVDVVGIDDDRLAAATDDIRVALDTFARCLKKSEWPGLAGRSPGIRYARLTPWQETKIQNRRAQLTEDLQD